MDPRMTFTTGFSGTTFFSTIDEAVKVSQEAMLKELEKRKKEEEEKRIKEEELLKEGKAVKDLDSKIISFPTAILRENIIIKKNEEGNEEFDESCVELEIVEQKHEFRFQYNVYKNDEIKRRDYWLYEDDDDEEEDEDVKRIVGIVDDGCFEQRDNGFFQTFYFRGRNRYDSGKKVFKVSFEDYKYLKKCFLESGVEIMSSGKEIPVKEEIKKDVSYKFSTRAKKKEYDEMIALVDKKKFAQVIRARLIKDNTIADIAKIDDKLIEKYLETWAKNKYKYFKIFGNKLTLETDVEVQPNPKEIETKWKEIRSQFPLYRGVFNSISTNAVVLNDIGKRCDCRIESCFFESPKVKEQMSFTKLISLYGNNELDMEVSKIYQEKGKAHLVISINPIDYLTVSINGSEWDSCHHFLKGAYRNAGLSYMNDKTSLVAFRSDKDVEYYLHGKRIRWNCKSWRQMIYVSESDSTIVFSRQYPFKSDELSWHIRQLFEKAFSEHFGGQNKWRIFNQKNQANVSVQKNRGATLYNDVGCGFEHKVIKAKDDVAEDGYQIIKIGAQPYGIISESKITGESNHIW